MNDISSVEQTLMRLFDTPGYQWLIVLVALTAGAVHALKPGHGKSITAAYLVGAHGRVIHAVYLGFVVAAMHTVTAILLALVWQGLRTVLPFGFEDMTAGLRIAAAVIVILVGVALVRRRGGGHHHHHHATAVAPVGAHATTAAPGGGAPHTHPHHHRHDHDHNHDGHEDYGHNRAQGHEHGHHRGHSHTSPDANPFTRRGLVALGLSGGLVPSPTVFLLLVSGLVTGRVGFAVLLVLLFGVGMMLTICAVGVLTLRGVRLVEMGTSRTGWAGRTVQVLPRVAAYLVLALGVAYLFLGVRGFVA